MINLFIKQFTRKASHSRYGFVFLCYKTRNHILKSTHSQSVRPQCSNHDGYHEPCRKITNLRKRC